MVASGAFMPSSHTCTPLAVGALLYRVARQHLVDSARTGTPVADLADCFEAHAKQVDHATGGSWTASRIHHIDGSISFVGPQVGKTALTIYVDGSIYVGRHELGPGELVSLTPVIIMPTREIGFHPPDPTRGRRL